MSFASCTSRYKSTADMIVHDIESGTEEITFKASVVDKLKKMLLSCSLKNAEKLSNVPSIDVPTARSENHSTM